MYNTLRKTNTDAFEKIKIPKHTVNNNLRRVNPNDMSVVDEDEFIPTMAADELAMEKDAFEREAVPHLNALYNFAYKMLGNKLDADDMIQETYMRAYRFFKSYEKGTNCKAWLFRIMKNVIINKYRKEQKDAATVGFDEVMNYVSTIKSNQFDSDDFQEALFSRLLDDEMAIALNSIHDDFKIVVILCDLEGLSYEEIAEFLHCPIGTVRSRLHRGRRLLQQKLVIYARQRGYHV